MEGGDTDTIAALTGALVGAHTGPKFAESLPVNRLEDAEPFLAYLRELSKKLCDPS
ncbi:MAG: ADP-ribosylglycohydrolase family protein [Pirellulales bacterium]